MTFTESTYYILQDGKVYRKTVAGLFEEKWSIARKISDDVKIHVDHFDCAVPYSNYYILDYKNQKIYESKDHFSYYGGNLRELVDALKTYGIDWVIKG